VRVLIDTHAFLWFLTADSSLSSPAEAAIRDIDNEAFVSMVTLWEVSIKHGLGKLQLADVPEVFFPSQLAKNSIRVLNISAVHAFKAGALAITDHKDPFDRLLAAQSLVEQIPLVSKDAQFDRYGVTRIW
jgi:PIN domain nuclease of toxin-antitoxin system